MKARGVGSTWLMMSPTMLCELGSKGKAWENKMEVEEESVNQKQKIKRHPISFHFIKRNFPRLPGKRKISNNSCSGEQMPNSLTCVLVSLIRNEPDAPPSIPAVENISLDAATSQPAGSCTAKFPPSQFPSSARCVKRAEISHRVFTRDKSNFHKLHQLLQMIAPPRRQPTPPPSYAQILNVQIRTGQVLQVGRPGGAFYGHQ